MDQKLRFMRNQLVLLVKPAHTVAIRDVQKNSDVADSYKYHKIAA
jgi:hypothetical protein